MMERVKAAGRKMDAALSTRRLKRNSLTSIPNRTTGKTILDKLSATETLRATLADTCTLEALGWHSRDKGCRSRDERQDEMQLHG